MVYANPCGTCKNTSDPGEREFKLIVVFDVWLVSFMDYDLAYFDMETRRMSALENPFGPKVIGM